jgi:hypothetical protein
VFGAILTAVWMRDRRRAADQQRRLDILARHLARDVLHLVQRRRDEPRQANHVDVVLGCRREILSLATMTPRSMTS